MHFNCTRHFVMESLLRVDVYFFSVSLVFQRSQVGTFAISTKKTSKFFCGAGFEPDCLDSGESPLKGQCPKNCRGSLIHSQAPRNGHDFELGATENLAIDTVLAYLSEDFNGHQNLYTHYPSVVCPHQDRQGPLLLRWWRYRVIFITEHQKKH